MNPFMIRLGLFAGLACVPALAHDPIVRMEGIEVFSRTNHLLGEASGASEGEVGPSQLATRPFLRRGELLEAVPGIVITQHSGSGKANQYFLRGFNLDHGTDFAVSVGGMPVNLRSHGHGQGYSDLNFLIPEFLQGISYQKGSHVLTNGDFSAAGAAQFHLATAVPAPFAKVEVGENQHLRFVTGATVRSGATATSTVGLEAGYYNGPWDRPENSRRFNALIRQAWVSQGADVALTALGYRGEWHSTDQVPLRAIEGGLISRFGIIDPTGGGDSDRASLSFDWKKELRGVATAVNAYAVRYRMDLYSNFTYFLDDPVNGDQFNQRDDRTLLGASLTHRRPVTWAGLRTETILGVQLRSDEVDLELNRTSARQLLSTVRADEVRESSAGVFAGALVRFSDRLRAEAGLRGDFYRFRVESDNVLNSGRRAAGIGSPKLSLAFQVTPKTELYANAGYGFHSNDARGTVIAVNPVDGSPADPVTPLARARSAELGLRTAAVPGLVSTTSVWLLDLDSELVFVGDAGATEAAGATRRYGVEFANFYRVNPWLAFDADVAFTHGRYRDAPGADRIANSLDTIATGGAIVELPGGFSGALRWRYFGPQPLVEDNRVRSPSSLTLNARFAWRTPHWDIALDVLNLLDRRNEDIAYAYTSALPGEPAGGVDDRHVHPGEPRQFRLVFTRRF